MLNGWHLDKAQIFKPFFLSIKILSTSLCKYIRVVECIGIPLYFVMHLRRFEVVILTSISKRKL